MSYPESETTAWAWGPYRRTMGKDDDPERMRRATLAIKRELTYLGYEGLDLTHPRFGGAAETFVKRFQRDNDLRHDGLVGAKTANALWRTRILALQEQHGIPNDWLRAQVHWESADDPAARNPGLGGYGDGSVDRGLVQLNSTRKPATDDEAFDPGFALGYLAAYLEAQQKKFANCAFGTADAIEVAVGSWRTPVGAMDWCTEGATEPVKDGTWAQKAVYYVSRVNTDGRSGWVG